MNLEYNRKLITEYGEEYVGFAFGSQSDKVAEVVFNTSPVGYQEIVSDPSYTYQTVVMAYPLIGNYGVTKDDFETLSPTISGLIVRDYCDTPSNFRSEETLSELMTRFDISGISGIDTRKLVRSIREKGSFRALITDITTTVEDAKKIIKEYEQKNDAVSIVSRKDIEKSFVDGAKYNVVAIDCGMKQNIVRSLNNRLCNVTIVPWNISVDEICTLTPDGIFISNGPGDPENVTPTIELIKQLKGKYPMFGICLGHQIIALAYGAKTYKLKFGHRGGNHPVRNIATGKIEITSQNHSYAVDPGSLAKTSLSVTHVNILDNTIEGLESKADNVFSVQYHPESAPGPQDSAYLFDHFLDMMEAFKNAKEN